MKLKAPFYDGDSILRDGPAAEIEEHVAASKVGGEKDAPHCTNGSFGGAAEVRGIEARARRLRQQTIAGYFSRFWTWLGAQLDRARQRTEEEYLARAQNVAELEERLRKIEREGRLLHT